MAINDDLRAFYVSELGVTSGSISDLEYLWLKLKTSSDGPIPDLWYKYLIGQGYTGTLSGMRSQLPYPLGRATPYSTEATSLFARMTSEPTHPRKRLYDNLILSLKAVGVFSKLDTLYILAAHDAQAAQRNWIADAYNLTPVASPTFTVNRGYQGDGSTSYLNTGFQPGVSVGSKALQDSNTMGVWSLTNITAATVDIGNTNNSISSRSTTSGMATRDMSATVTSTATANSLGLTSMARTAAGTYRVGKNGVKLADIVVASAAPTSADLYILGRNNAGALAAPSTRQIAAVYAGSFLTEAEELAFYTALSTYLTAVGAI